MDFITHSLGGKSFQMGTLLKGHSIQTIHDYVLHKVSQLKTPERTITNWTDDPTDFPQIQDLQYQQ
jgi:hypothetical protein